MILIAKVCLIVGECFNEQGLLANLPDSSLSESSFRTINEQRDASKSRLNPLQSGNHENVGLRPNDDNIREWIQADLLVIVHVYRIDTKGYRITQFQHWIKTFQLQYRSGTEKSRIVTSSTGGITFDANFDAETVVTNEFPPVVARVVRLYPLTWLRAITLLWELYSCTEG